MSDRSNKMVALHFPKELTISDTNCVVCLDDARAPVFCTTCAKLLCYDCMVKCQRENGCATCRSKEPEEIYTVQSTTYACEQHSLLVTMVCVDCNECVCKLCIGKNSKHSLHAFKSIDDIRTELAEKMSKLYDYLRMVEGLESISEFASNFNDSLLNVATFDITVRSCRNKISKFIEETEAYNMKNLISRRTELKQQVEKILEEIENSKEKEPEAIYEFVSNSFSIERLSSARGCYLCEIDDEQGNLWQIRLYSNYTKMLQNVPFIAFDVILLSGTPGRYEIKIDCDNPTVRFQKVIETARISVASKVYKLRPNADLRGDLTLTVGLRPTNFKYHLQCARIYRQIVNDPANNKYCEKLFQMKPKASKDEFIKDKTGTIWRFQFNCLENNRKRYFSATLEHYDGAVGRFDFFILIEDSRPGAQPVIKKYTKKDVTFGSKYHTVMLKEPNILPHTKTGVRVGIRPSVKSSETSFFSMIFSK